MPGVNVPWSQVLYYLVTLTISGVFHEFGHAISAIRYVAFRIILFGEQREIRMEVTWKPISILFTSSSEDLRRGIICAMEAYTVDQAINIGVY